MIEMASIRCAHCKNTHGTVAEVRVCAMGARVGVGSGRDAFAAKPTPSVREREVREGRPKTYEEVVAEREHAVSVADRVEAGRYAIVENGKLHFYKVDRPAEGRWSGYTFVSEIVGGGFSGSSVRYPVKGKTRRQAVLAGIARDAKAALTRYGQELGVCGHCGRELTDEDSRARGIGPVCAGNLGW